jgi:nucleolar protein 16
LNRFEKDSDAESEEEAEEWGGFEEDKEKERPMVIRELEREANLPREKRFVRHQSEREVEWLKSLVARHGDDVEKMARDAKLNPMQQTKADIAKRLRTAGLLQ